jgi:endonuclease-3
MKPADAGDVVKRLRKEYPGATIALKYFSPHELLVATILSAQCTDARVNIVTEALFKKYKSVKDYAGADIKQFEQEIRSTGFFRNKAKNIINASKMILRDYGGKVPNTMEEILKLPGVARKTANIVLSNAYGIVEGIAVDTHVIRLTRLLGLTRNENPEKIEQDLMKIVPRRDWQDFSYLIQAHGRKICIARRPNHAMCVLKDICPSAKI